MESEVYDVAVIGSGPSGLTAAIYTARGAASTIVFAGNNWGGQLMLTTTVENFPGFPDGIEGPELMRKMRSQAEKFGTRFIEENADTVNFKKFPYEIFSGGNVYKAKTIIIATGALTKWLGVPGEDRLRGRGVSSCAPCDAPFFKNKKVAVVGGGDAAMEEVLVLTKYASSVILLHRSGSFRASAVMQERVFEKEKEGVVKIIWDSEIVEIFGENVVSGIKVKTKKEGKKQVSAEGKVIEEDNDFIIWELLVDGLFVAIGHKPDSDIFKGSVEMDEKGFIKKANSQKLIANSFIGKEEVSETLKYQSATNVDGIFVAGDVCDDKYKQAITAAGFGCQAGMDALKYLDKEMSSY